MSTNPYKTLSFHVRGITPLVMANCALADPRNKYAQEIATIKLKPPKRKTLQDHERVQDLQWWGSLYREKDDEGELAIPARCIEGMLKSAATEQRKGTDVRIGCYAPKAHYKLTYKGPKDLAKLALDTAFRMTFLQPTASGGKTLTTYPMFPEWELEFDVCYHPEKLNPSAIERMVDHAGAFLGFLALRPRHGRFVTTNGSQ
mgnify:CR=1 FL=1